MDCSPKKVVVVEKTAVVESWPLVDGSTVVPQYVK